jgi:hypothetical protein
MPNYQITQVGAVHRRVTSITVEMSDPRNGNVRIEEADAILTTEGEVLRVRGGRTLNASISPAMMAQAFPTVNLTTGLQTANGTITGQAVVAGLQALARSAQIAADAAEAPAS